MATARLRWQESLSQDAGNRTYLVTDAADIGEAYTAARSAAGSTWMNLKQRDAHVDDAVPTAGGDLVYFITVNFASADAAGGRGKVAGDSAFSFDTTGGTTHITHAKAHVQSYGLLGSVTHNVDGAINVDKKTVKGVDIVTPVYKFSETHYVANASVDATYKGTLYRLTGRVNDASFKGCNAGECLFLGARGSKRPQGDWEINFDFAGSPNLTNVEIGPDLVASAVGGWHYLWVEWQTNANDTLKTFEQTALYANVERVYDPDDFSDLGIGT